MMQSSEIRNSETQGQWEPDIIDIRRNPYLVEYEEQRRLRSSLRDTQPGRSAASQSRTAANVAQSRTAARGSATSQSRAAVRNGRAAYGRTEEQSRRRKQEMMDVIEPEALRSRAVQGRVSARNVGAAQSRTAANVAQSRTAARGRAAAQGRAGQNRTTAQSRTVVRRSGETLQIMPAEKALSRQAALKRRRRYIRRQRIAVGIFTCCIAAAFYILIARPGSAAAAGTDRGNTSHSITNETQGQDLLIQGLPAVAFSAHPAWTEDFLTPNEYSRPGEPLPEVNNIFVHYTANPGTSAAQNRSYFEQQKDMHQVSVSAHFIIGYEGEILQCIPMDEIAYAVQTRNYDSVSIECCYKEADGSFTQETYDSLIALLAWLTDIYDLDTEDILRHYDCGGKKCPLYYTEHPDAWERLQDDVAKAKKN